jgi:putative selenate reductase
MSVGYDLKGIQSNKVDGFINDMKQAANTAEWKSDLCYLRGHLTEFGCLTLEDIDQIEERDCISDTITLSTMHGCESSEIEQIATYLLRVKKLNTYIKMNPTLVGKEMVQTIFHTKGYTNLEFEDEIFDQDITLDMAEQIIRSCQTVATQGQKEFGIKLTNTFPVKVTNQELDASQMYLSGPPLYPIAINAANLISKRFQGKLPISYSGGADEANILELFEAGFCCITVSSLLLKPGGYKNLTKLIKKAEGMSKKDQMDEIVLDALAITAINDSKYNNKKSIKFERKLEYSILCAKCNNCVDVCPNRANILVETENKKMVFHLDSLCNECGSCACECILGHRPYFEKFTIFEEAEAFSHSRNPGVLYQNGIQRYRVPVTEGEMTDNIYQLIRAGIIKGRIGYEL